MKGAFEGLQIATLIALLILSYGSAGTTFSCLAASALLIGFGWSVRKARANSLDWAMLLVAVYEIPSLLLSHYPANGIQTTTIILLAVSCYLLTRLIAPTLRRDLVLPGLVGVGGVALACFAVGQFNHRVHSLRENGLTDIVAFRAWLITPPSTWLLGEWLTLLLLTLPLALAVPVFLWLDRRRVLAASTALMSAAIAAALQLSCSRAIFWGLIISPAVTAVTAAVYRIVRTKSALIAITAALSVTGLVLAGENVRYPGVLEAYMGRHTSQLRSTEGRLAIWKRSTEVFKLSPFWGVGSGNAPLFLTSSAEQEETTGFASRTFSLPIQVLTEKGAIGATLYLAVLALAGREAHRKLRNPKVPPQIKGVTCCLMAGVIAVLFRELTYSSLLEHAATAMLFTMSLALLAAEEPA
jgi:O-antigen ligase